jgi:hypothetical protein
MNKKSNTLSKSQQQDANRGGVEATPGGSARCPHHNNTQIGGISNEEHTTDSGKSSEEVETTYFGSSDTRVWRRQEAKTANL